MLQSTTLSLSRHSLLRNFQVAEFCKGYKKVVRRMSNNNSPIASDDSKQGQTSQHHNDDTSVSAKTIIRFKRWKVHKKSYLYASKRAYKLVICSKYSSELDFLTSIKENIFKLPQEKAVVIVQYENDTVIDDGSFNLNMYMDTIATNQFGRLLLWSPRLHSTHTFLSENFNIFPVGTTCVADIQEQGRGRTKNQWESPKGCLMFSFILTMTDGRILPLLQYVVSLAVIEAIELVCQEKSVVVPSVKIKWPNDIYAEGLKIGGVLCTSTYSSKTFNVTVGIGLNVDNEKPTTCLNSILQNLTNSNRLVRKEELLVAFLRKFEILYDIFLTRGFSALEGEYYKKWLHSEQAVLLEENQEQGDCSTVSLTIKGLTSSGYLLAVDKNDNKYELHPDGNSFDFFKGLVRRKLQ